MVVAVMTVMAVMAAEVGSGGSTGDWWWYGGGAWGQAVTRRRFCRETFETKRVFNHVLSWTDRGPGGPHFCRLLDAGVDNNCHTFEQWNGERNHNNFSGNNKKSGHTESERTNVTTL